jgi:hypothetical protein
MNGMLEGLVIIQLVLGLALGFTFLFAVFRDLRR